MAHVVLLDPAGLWVEGSEEANRLGTDERMEGSARGRAAILTADRRDIVGSGPMSLWSRTVQRVDTKGSRNSRLMT